MKKMFSMVCVACAMSVILSCGGNQSAGNSTDSSADSKVVNQSAGNNAASAVSVSGGNPAISAAEDFIENPCEETFKAVEEAVKHLDDEKKEYEKWCEEHASDLVRALLKSEAVEHDADTALGNAISAAQAFIENPCEETAKAVDEAEKDLDADEKKEYEKWCEEHETELAAAMLKGVAAEIEAAAK